MFNGPEPTIATFDSNDAEVAGVTGFIRAALADGLAPSEIGVFVRTRDQLSRARAAVHAAGQQPFELSEGVEDSGDRLSIGTMHLAKGAGVQAVAVMACDDEVLPLAERSKR